jgi:hypothetical protein
MQLWCEMPLGALILLILLFIICALILTARHLSDRKRITKEPERRRSSVTSGNGVTCIPVEVQLGAAEARMLAEEAIRHVGGEQIEVWNSSTVTGWTPKVALEIGWAPQQVSIVIQPKESGHECLLLCCSRPRFAMALSDGGQARRTAGRLAEFVREAGAHT